jgi:carboxypeptidase family protein
MRRLIVVVASLVTAAACGSKGPTGPSNTARFALSGIVTGAGGGGVAGASVEVIAGVNVGTATMADGGGRYTLSNLSTGAMTIRASAQGFIPQTTDINLTADQPANFSLSLASFFTNGKVLDAVTQAGFGNVALSGDGIIGSASDANGSFSVIASAGSTDPRLVIFTSPKIIERRTNVRVPGSDINVSLISSMFDVRAFDEMFRTTMLTRWTSAPPLLVETRALQFTSINAADQVALADQMSDSEYNSLVNDLSWALPQMTGGAFSSFASVSRQTSPEGTNVHILNSNVITVSRVVGLFGATGFWGYSRWQYRPDGTIIAGIVTLDRDFERSGSGFIRALRSHELGHGLGYNHVTVRFSVMNASGRVEPNSWDLDAARVAFQRPPGNRSPDTDPGGWSTNTVSGPAVWSPPIR